MSVSTAVATTYQMKLHYVRDVDIVSELDTYFNDKKIRNIFDIIDEQINSDDTIDLQFTSVLTKERLIKEMENNFQDIEIACETLEPIDDYTGQSKTQDIETKFLKDISIRKLHRLYLKKVANTKNDHQQMIGTKRKMYSSEDENESDDDDETSIGSTHTGEDENEYDDENSVSSVHAGGDNSSEEED